MYRNAEHYAAPTEGKAIAHVMAEMQRAKRREGIRKLPEKKRPAPAAKKPEKPIQIKAITRKAKDTQYILAWESSDTPCKPVRAKAV